MAHVSQPGASRRQIRNYLLDRRFQFKHVGMVMAVVLAVASVLGYCAYDYSKGQSEALAIQMAMQPDLNPAAAQNLEAWADEQDRRVALAIIAGILLLVLAMAATGIVITHRMVGPAYKIKRLLAEVQNGNLSVQARFRKSDELQDIGDAFSEMVLGLRARREEELLALENLFATASEQGAPEEVTRRLGQICESMRRQLQSRT
ncbi:MAG: methyl-accepting chemotaxis protein [Myxococcales bacterium]|nr:methyl-accepting chemotaxis protein [Myxococcales bacterium]MCB9708417.1 methyl-accepting chemotaxis protein [Myxococcales bacterium]